MSGWFIDPAALPQGGDGFCQIMFLFCVYGYVLAYASDMISNGSDLLLLVPEYAGVVGSIVLPVLGAVPDGMLILFSGMGDDAQNQLSVSEQLYYTASNHTPSLHPIAYRWEWAPWPAPPSCCSPFPGSCPSTVAG